MKVYKDIYLSIKITFAIFNTELTVTEEIIEMALASKHALLNSHLQT